MNLLSHLVQAAALVLLLFLIGQATVLLIGFVRRLSYARTRHKLELEIFTERLRAARAETKKKEDTVLPWNGYRKFRVDQKVRECEGVCSFYLKPHDERSVPAFLPGQYLTFEVGIPGRDRNVVRCYSLSDRPRDGRYRITVKRIPAPHNQPQAPAGLVSDHFCTRVKEGDILDVKAPSGGFFLNTSCDTPVVLIAGGVGVTPVLSMLNDIIESGSRRETWFFYGVRDSQDHIMKEHLHRVARESDFVRLRVCYSRPRPGDADGEDYQHEGRVSVDLLKRELPSNNFDFYVCGPGEMMTGMITGLREWGVPERSIHFEAFGPASVNRPPQPEKTRKAAGATVSFARSGKSQPWSPESESLLGFAERLDVRIDSGCRAGNCGTCKTAIKSGKVTYLKEPGCEVEPGSCLTCICVPEAELVLDA